MTIAVTRNVPNRYTGFLASVMHVIAPGVYVAPDMTKGVRERLWQVMVDWASLLDADAGVVLFWQRSEAPSGMAMRMIGWPKKDMVNHEGLWLTMRDLTAEDDVEELQQLAGMTEPPRDARDPVFPPPVPVAVDDAGDDTDAASGGHSE